MGKRAKKPDLFLLFLDHIFRPFMIAFLLFIAGSALMFFVFEPIMDTYGNNAYINTDTVPWMLICLGVGVFAYLVYRSAASKD